MTQGILAMEALKKIDIKTVIIIVAVVVILFFVFKGKKKVEEVVEEKQEDKIDEQIQNKKAEDGALTRSVSSVQIRKIASENYNAMKGAGTNPVTIINALSRLNGKDLLAVYEAYGWKDYRHWWGGSTRLNLFGWYKEEFSNENQKYKEQLQSIWDRAGVILNLD
jgi:Ca2+/Na+ antiporter